MDPIKEAFLRAKQDISDLTEQVAWLSSQIEELRDMLIHQISSQPVIIQPTHPIDQQTNKPIIPTHKLNEPSIMPLNDLKSPNTVVSIGNGGVPTNQPTNQQTNQRIGNEGVAINTNPINSQKDPKSSLYNVSQLLESLDVVKKDVRSKFKKLTDQEMSVYSTIYESDNQGILVDYSFLAQKLNLSEISIRDYIRKLFGKGIPLTKSKENNKKILLSIPQEFKQLASLSTILSLRAI